MDSFSKEDLEIKFREEPGKNVMVWSGESRSRNPAAELEVYLTSIVDDLVGKDLEIEFLEVNFINSSTVIPIIHMMSLFNKKEIKSTLYYKKDSKWQFASFKALETITKGLKYIDVLPR